MSKYKPTYKLFIRIQRAQGLVPLRGTSTLNPYVVFQMQGSTEKVKTKVTKNSINPIYSTEFALDGYFIGSDLLHIWVYTRGEGKESDDEVVGYANTYVNTFLLGEVQNYTINLYEYDKLKKTMCLISEPGSAGKIYCQFHVSKIDENEEDNNEDLLLDKPFVNKVWTYPFYNAWIEVIDANNYPAVNEDSAYLFISLFISPATNTQLFQTRMIDSQNTI